MGRRRQPRDPKRVPLRRDLHRLFDLGYVTIRPNLTVAVNTRLRDDYANGKIYYELDGKPISTGMMFVHEDVAILAGASTIPEGRNNGAQNALLAARLKSASEMGCALAIMGALPGSQSQKNAQRNGFHIAYTRTKWQLVE